MKKIIILIFFCSLIQAQTFSIGQLKFYKEHQIDGWSAVHFMGSYLLYGFLDYASGWSTGKLFLITFGVGIGKEIICDAYGDDDSAGDLVGDLWFDLLGCALASFVREVSLSSVRISLNKERKVLCFNFML